MKTYKVYYDSGSDGAFYCSIDADSFLVNEHYQYVFVKDGQEIAWISTDRVITISIGDAIKD